MSLGKTPGDTGDARDRGEGGADGGTASAGTRHLDASGLKAYAHPLRLQIIRYLNDHGPATATQLSRHLGESTGQTSYHLRQLARHGLVVDDPDRNRGRERWWKATSFQVDAAQLADDPALAPAAQAVLGSVAQGRTEALNRWLTSAGPVPREWVEASLHSQSTLRLTPSEVQEMTAAMLEVLDRYAARSRAREAGDHDSAPGARVRAYLDVFPLLDDD
ncbi:transcriptional regulator [uncultured Cellulomonas sp.]|uniref:ArsR/SmtB family transcription factor n=1 Tax=uncultured Cellulomonas sp. TaxID=189682 RepID=UPI002629D3E4|nr:winged helix-turn-helix domain-containing protein [uncultured Cellulomonas sp.]